MNDADTDRSCGEDLAYSLSMSLKREVCIGTHTLWNSRIGKIRLFSLWSLAERFFEPFCNSVDFSVGIVENAALFGQHVLEVAAAGHDLVESPTDFADGGECG